MKKQTRVVLMLALSMVVFLAACGNKYGEAKSVLEKQADIFENYIGSMDKAENADDLVKAINTFTSDMNAMIPKLKSISEKYPDLEKSDEPPEELKPSIERIEALSEKMSGAMMKCFQYMQDPKVQEAMKEQGRILNEAVKKG